MANDFIGIYENVLAPEACNKLITFFESCHELGFTVNRQQHDKVSKIEKDDVSLHTSHILDLYNYRPVANFLDAFWGKAYPQYKDQYHMLDKVGQHMVSDVKIQRTLVGGGFHVWHCEQANQVSSSRLLAYTCYLNDVEEGGETEFLYYPKRVKATQGTFLLFPGGFTHTHRGNPPISNTKYIVTGWVQFCS